MQEFQISLDWEEFDHKPSTKLQYQDYVDKFGNPRTEARVIGARLGSDVETLNIVKLAKAIMRGQTWSPYVFKTCPDWKRRRRLEGLFESCQVFALDFDNGKTLEEIQEKASGIGVNLSLIHTSFSSVPTYPKHRAILILDEPLVDFTQTKKISIGLAKAFDSDEACVDTARLYFGSGPDCIVFLDRDAKTTVKTLEEIAASVKADQFLTSSKLNQDKPDEAIWGSEQVQLELFSKIPRDKLNSIKRKIKGILMEIEGYDPSTSKKTSRYDCVWRNSSRIARMPEVTGHMTHSWVLDAISKNSQFDDWDKDASAVVTSAITWSANHADDPV